MDYQDNYYIRGFNKENKESEKKLIDNNIKVKLNQYDLIPEVISSIINKIQPKKIILFGSCARRNITIKSDIDICIVVEEDIDSKERVELRSMLLLEMIEITDFEVDIFICTEKEWNKKKTNQSTFIGKIFKEGEMLYGR